MGNGMQFVDIIFFALVAAFLILQLRRVLGRRDGHEGGHQDPFAPPQKRESESQKDNDTVVQLPDRSTETQSTKDRTEEPAAPDFGGSSPLNEGLIKITKADASFNPQEFLSGARIAFDLIVGSFISADARTLKTLVSPEVLANFTRAIYDREKAGEVMEDSLVGIKTIEIVEAYMEDSVAHITVKFISEQVNVMRDENGDVVSGNPNKVNDVTDFWTFARNTESRDPNWTLVATRSLD